jgi:RNA polymerase sigma-70 factor (ECF subfamily)
MKDAIPVRREDDVLLPSGSWPVRRPPAREPSDEFSPPAAVHTAMSTQTIEAGERGLTACAQAGDERAFRELTEPYRRELEIHCYRMIGSPHDAEDLVQETLLRAWGALGRFERRASVRTWLYRIATNACLDEIERRPRRPEPVQPFPDQRVEEAASPVYDPAARYAVREGMELALLTAIRALPGRQRAVLILRDVLGWTAAEVADLLDTTVAGTNSALQRARATVDVAMPASRGSPRRASASSSPATSTRGSASTSTGSSPSCARTPSCGCRPSRRSPAPRRSAASSPGRAAAAGSPTCAPSAPGPTGAPAIVMHRRRPGGELDPHGVLLLDVAGGIVAGIDAFIDGELTSRFAAP